MINEITREYIDTLLEKGERGESFADFRREALEENIPIITEDVERLITIILRASGAKRLFEIGTATGYSSCVFAKAMGSDSYVKTVERDDYRYFRALDNIERLGFSENIQAVKDDAQEMMRAEKETFDVVFLDGNKGHYIHMLEECKRILKPGGLLICDNVLFRGMIDKSSPLIRRKITIVKRLRMFLDAISEDDELITSVLPIGDGLSISIKK